MAHYKKCERRINRTIYEYNLSNNFVLEKKFSPYSYFSVVSVVLYNAINFSSFVCVCVYVATSEVAIFFFFKFLFLLIYGKKKLTEFISFVYFLFIQLYNQRVLAIRQRCMSCMCTYISWIDTKYCFFRPLFTLILIISGYLT